MIFDNNGYIIFLMKPQFHSVFFGKVLRFIPLVIIFSLIYNCKNNTVFNIFEYSLVFNYRY